MECYAGIDAGSTYVKVAIVSDQTLMACKVAPTGIDCPKTARHLFESLLNELGIPKSDVISVVSTGYGRRTIDFADETISEITAHASGTIWTAPEQTRIKTLVDIGGQDSKVIMLGEEKEVKNFAMNDKCAAGTGRFIEVLAQTLETTVDEIGPLSLQAKAPCQINSLCVVFAQSEVISLLAQGKDREDIIAGIHNSFAKRILGMARKIGLEAEVLLSGGGALNPGIVASFEDESMMDIHIAKNPQFNGAIGAAILAGKR